MAQFGELLAELREDRKLTQKELAEIIYVSPGTISNYENGVDDAVQIYRRMFLMRP